MIPAQVTIPIPTKSIVRTIVPIAIGFGISLLAHLGIKNPVYISAIGSGGAAIYYSVIRTLEAKYPKLGYLLGALGAPIYPAAPPVLRKSAGPIPSPMAMATGTTTDPSLPK